MTWFPKGDPFNVHTTGPSPTTAATPRPTEVFTAIDVWLAMALALVVTVDRKATSSSGGVAQNKPSLGGAPLGTAKRLT